MNILKKKLMHCLDELDKKDPKIIIMTGIIMMVFGTILVII